MILFNFDFFNTELRNHTMDYVKKEYKEELEKNAKLWDFHGKGFKTKRALVEFIHEKTRIPEKYFSVKDMTSPHYKINQGTIESLYTLFITETPLYLDREKVYKLMLLTSNLMFSPNEKICFTIMLENPDKKWTAQEIVDEIKKHSFTEDLKVEKIEESLNRHVVNNDRRNALLSLEIEKRQKLYRIHFTNLVYYVRQFE